MKIIVLGTTHEIQASDYNSTNEFRRVLEYIIARWNVQVVMEEWTSQKTATIGRRLAEERNVNWVNAGTPHTSEFETSVPLFEPMETPPIVLNSYGPMAVQIRREEYMAEEISKAMEGLLSGMFIVGLAHLHSMSERLQKRGFEVEAFHWMAPPVLLYGCDR